VPAIVAVADQRVNAVGARADVQHLYRGAAWNHAVVVGGQQVGEEMHVIRSSRHRRAQVIGGNVPVSDAVKRFEQRPIEHAHRIGVGEVDAFLAVRVDDHELRQFRHALDQRREVVTTLMAVARVQGGLFTRLDVLGRGRGLRLLARRFRCAGGIHGRGRHRVWLKVAGIVPQGTALLSGKVPGTKKGGLAGLPDSLRMAVTGWQSARVARPACPAPVRLRPAWRVPSR